jgi:hypothetical protein
MPILKMNLTLINVIIYDDTSSYISHNPGISILSGLAIVGVTEPLALPWVALGTVTPFILGYRVLGHFKHA